MTFEEILDQAVAMIQRRRRVTYRTLKLQFKLDDETLEALKEELFYSQPQVVDDEGRGLIWTSGTEESLVTTSQLNQSEPQSVVEQAQPVQATSQPVASHTPEAERRQLTVMFVDLVGSTSLSGELDPEDLREVVRAYQSTCTEVIHRYDGYVAQLLGDGLLVYFGYPQAHEDDAQRAVRTGLGMVEAIGALNTRLEQDQGITLAVRLGLHTGLVVVGEMGGSGRQEQLALGEAPNMAARIQGLAAPDTVVISADTYRLIQGYFDCDPLGEHELRGVSQPIVVYRVLRVSGVQSRLDVMGATSLTPLVGREAELTLLVERWAQSQNGLGQVVLLSGEAGIGKSRLVYVLTERVVEDEALHLTLRCSPYHTHSSFYPIIEHLQRLLQWHREATPSARLATLEQALRTAGLPLEEAVPLLAALLAVPVPERYPSLKLSPQRQKQKTQEALAAWLLTAAMQQPVLAVCEDLHWADPSTLELLELLLEHGPTARLLLVLTARPDFRPTWAHRSSVTPLTLTRLTRSQIEEMVLRMTGGKPLPAEVLAQIVTKTDGIPLFVEELTKTVLETGVLQEQPEHYTLRGPLPPLAIPATLHDALMARLDRLAAVKVVAQLGATLGRSFAYELLQAVAPLEEGILRHGLQQLVEAELLYQRGIPPQATYLFKHALIQEAAYQSLLRSTRQQYHQQIAQVLEEQFAETIETQPELLAHHYTEAGLKEQAIRYWQRAGQRARQRSANLEAIGHLTTGLELLKTLPATPERTQQELELQIALGAPLIATKGWGAPECGKVYAQAHELCRQVGETAQLFPVLLGLFAFYFLRGEVQEARVLGEQLLSLAQRMKDPDLLVEAHLALGCTLMYLGEFIPARELLQQGIALYDPQQHRSHAFLYGQDPGVGCRIFEAWALWYLGYPEQAVQRSQEALLLAQELSHPYSLVWALNFVARLHQCRREGPVAQERAETAIALCTEQGFGLYLAGGTILRGWALAAQGEGTEGVAQMRRGLAAWRATGSELTVSYSLALLADGYGEIGEPSEGLPVLAEAFVSAHRTGDRFYEAELYRLNGELLLRKAVPAEQEAEDHFRQALAIARHQQAKSLELRVAMSLSRLWQQQDKRQDAYDLLAPVYNWFTEGFDTADLQEARALLDELGG